MPRRRDSFYNNLDIGRALLMAMPFGLAGVAAQNLSAVDHNVNDLASLRTAIDMVNQSSTNDRIIISSATITLDAGRGDDQNVTGDLDIRKDVGNLEILGAGKTATTLDAAGEDRVFDIQTGAGATITIRDLRITGGQAEDQFGAGGADGGGIAFLGEELILDNLEISGNAALGAVGAPGATGTTSNPTGGVGGAGQDARGGGVFANGTTVSVTNCDILSNTATGGLGGQGGDASGFSAGQGGAGGAGGNAAGGGVVLVGNKTIADSLIQQNSASAGAGGGGGQGGQGFSISVGAGGDGGAGGASFGGGLAVSTPGQITISGLTVESNMGTGGAGGNGADGLSGSFMPGQPGGAGGGGSALGGGIYVVGAVEITDSSVNLNNVTGGNGGLAGNAGGAFSFADDGAVGGSGGSAGGGGLYVFGEFNLASALSMDGNIAQGGAGASGRDGGDGFFSGGAGGAGGAGGNAAGGGLFLLPGTVTGVIESSTVHDCEANGGAGGLGGAAGNASSSSASAATGGNGGGGGGAAGGALYISNTSSVEIVNSTLAQCVAQGGTGGNGADGVTFTTTGSSIVGGNGGNGGAGGSTQGGGVYHESGSLSIFNSTLAGHMGVASQPGQGGAGGAGTGANVGNPGANGTSRPSQGGGIFNNAGTSVDIESTIVAGGSAGDGPDLNGSFTVAGSLIQDTTGATITGTPITGDPLLGPLQDNGGPTLTMSIDASSPARNVGSNPQSLTTDQRGLGFDRDDGAGVDIGAIELGASGNTSGGGGGDRDDDDDCSTGTNSGGSWLMLAGLLAALAAGFRGVFYRRKENS